MTETNPLPSPAPSPSAAPAATPAAMPTATPSAALPDRLSNDHRSPYFNEAAFERDVGIRVNGKEYSEVVEYCISEGWIKIPAGRTLDRKGFPLLMKLKGRVEAFYK